MPVVPAGVAEVLAILNSVRRGGRSARRGARGDEQRPDPRPGPRQPDRRPRAARAGPRRTPGQAPAHRRPADRPGARERRPRYFAVRVAPLEDDLIVVLADDQTVAAPDRGDPARLRGQRQPRAQDPDRRDLAARRGGRGRGRRPRCGAQVRQPDGRRIGPADRSGRPDHRAVPAAGRQPAGRSGGGRHRRGAQRRGRPAPGGRRAAPGHPDHRRRHRHPGAGQRPPAGRRGGQPGRERASSTPIPVPGWSSPRTSRPGATTTTSRSPSPTTASASRRPSSSGSSSASTGSTTPAAGPTVAPGSGLSIVKHIAANHGGEVSVWSQPGRGLDVHHQDPGPPAAAPDRAACP